MHYIKIITTKPLKPVIPTLQLICRYALVVLLLHAQGCGNSNTTPGPGNTTPGLAINKKYNKAYVVGGRASSGVVPTVQTFDGSTWTELTEGLKTAVSGSNSFVLNNKAYVVGGRASSGVVPTVQTFDGSTCTELAEGLKKAVSSANSFVLNNKAYVVGGRASSGAVPTEMFDGSTWTELTTWPKKVISIASSFVLNNKAYVVGGACQFRRCCTHRTNV